MKEALLHREACTRGRLSLRGSGLGRARLLPAPRDLNAVNRRMSNRVSGDLQVIAPSADERCTVPSRVQWLWNRSSNPQKMGFGKIMWGAAAVLHPFRIPQECVQRVRDGRPVARMQQEPDFMGHPPPPQTVPPPACLSVRWPRSAVQMCRPQMAFCASVSAARRAPCARCAVQ